MAATAIVTPGGIDLPFPLRRFSVDEFQAMANAGILAEEDRNELLAGWISPKMNRSPLHDAVINRLAELFHAVLPPGHAIRIQSAVLTEDSALEPDLAVVPGDALRYAAQHPRADETVIIVEVADSSLARDRFKADLYARGAASCYWIVNLVDRCVEIHTAPSDHGYQKTEARRDEDSLMAPVADGVSLGKVRDLLPPTP